MKQKKKSTLEMIVHAFPISNEEWEELDEEFGKLCYYAAWQLKRKNTQNYFSIDPQGEDEAQDLKIALMRAGAYYKRQIYIESSLASLKACAKEKFVKKITAELEKLWEDRRRHGANRQKFGNFQEVILDRLIKKYVPVSQRPRKSDRLKIDVKFRTYCKQIVWNAQKSLGKKITRDKSWTTGLVSLSEFDYLAQKSA